MAPEDDIVGSLLPEERRRVRHAIWEWRRTTQGCLSEAEIVELAEDAPPVVSQHPHVKDCPFCRAEVRRVSAALVGVVRAPSRREGSIAQRTAVFIQEHAVAAVIVLALACGGAGYGIADWWLSEKLDRMAQLRPQVEEYEAIWRELRFDELVRPMVRVLPAAPGVPPNCVRVELSPRVRIGLVREALVNFGDAGEEAWETIFELDGPGQRYEAIHEYALPPPGETHSWTLRVQFMVPDAVARAKRLTPNELTAAYTVTAKAAGIQVSAANGAQERERAVPAAVRPEVQWLEPPPGASVDWKPKVVLQSTTATERITLLVRPHSGSVFYVQPGARGLQAGTPETFTVQLGSGPSHAAGEEFDIIAVCTDTFLPAAWALEAGDVPISSVIGRVTVRKVKTPTDEGGIP